MLSELLKSTLAPGATLPPVASPLAATFHPALAVASTALSWLTFTASVSTAPAATLVMRRSAPTPPTDTSPTGVAPATDVAPVGT
ncbi:hypothetical protein D3C86_1199240 [compost metagenome]